MRRTGKGKEFTHGSLLKRVSDRGLARPQMRWRCRRLVGRLREPVSGHGLPHQFAWRFVAEFPLAEVAGSAAKWVVWSAEEKGPRRRQLMRLSCFLL